MSEAKPLNQLFKELPAVSNASGLYAILADSQGQPKRAPGSSFVNILSGGHPSASLSPGWIRIAKLGSTTSSAPTVTVYAHFTLLTWWATSSPRILCFDLYLCSAVWDWNNGNTSEGRFSIKTGGSADSIFTKFRIVVDYSGSVGSIYLEVYTDSTVSDYGKPCVYISPVIGSPVAMTPVAGSVPTGALSTEFTLSTIK